jgi:AcrR family transcriptional regulator
MRRRAETPATPESTPGPTPEPTPERVPTRDRLLRVAERLFALEGIDAVSMRRIGIEAGQRNKSALQYHFGDKDNLIRAIFAHRMGEINTRRQSMLDDILARGSGDNLHNLVSAVIVPFAEQLDDDNGGSHYVRFSAQLFAQGRAMALLPDRQPWTDALHALLEMIRRQLPGYTEAVVVERLALMADQVVHATAAKERQLAGLRPAQRRRRITTFVDNLVDYSVGGLTAPVRGHEGTSSV